MNDRLQTLAEIDALFSPESVAIVGLPQGMKTGKLFLLALRDMNFPGPIYAVNPNAREIDGLKCYPSVSSIPGPVDLAIVLAPSKFMLDTARDCVAKKVKGAVFFTAGGKETGTDEGRYMEKTLTELARESGMRVIGPNCMGLYSPKSGLSFFPGLSVTPGPVGLISHSGSLANIIGRIASEKGMAFSKVVSLGNECDLNSAHFMDYLGQDEETTVIGAYLEGIKDGPYFLQALKNAARNKPVVLWKVGLTPEGGRAASSHTGALAGSAEIWEGVIRQTGAIPVVGFEEWVDILMTCTQLPEELGDRMAIISGPGGLAVGASDAVGRAGLKLADLSPETVQTLSRFIPPTGTSLKNPIDVSLTASLQMEMYIEAARAAAADPLVDAVIMIGAGLSRETNIEYSEAMIQASREFNKPFLMVNIPGFDEELAHKLCESGLPFYMSAERAVAAYAKVRNYRLFRHKIAGR